MFFIFFELLSNMPELPEVEVVRSFLESRVIGKKILKVFKDDYFIISNDNGYEINKKK